MFLGHFGLAMGAKRVAPGPSLGTAILAAQWADGIWPFFVLLGVERLAVAPGITRVTPLDFVSYPYSHSLVADIGWAIAFALVYGTLRRNWRGAAWLGVLVLSHWVLDVVAHRPDMPTWPGGPKLGFGLWNSLPGTLIVEFVLLAAGTILLAMFVAVLGALFLASTFGPPPPSAQAVAITGVAGWLFVALGYWIDRHRALATPSRR
jgi:hypothetical protein